MFDGLSLFGSLLVGSTFVSSSFSKAPSPNSTFAGEGVPASQTMWKSLIVHCTNLTKDQQAHGRKIPAKKTSPEEFIPWTNYGQALGSSSNMQNIISTRWGGHLNRRNKVRSMS